ncbi:MAG: type II toxin-antitoxin system HicB family antitoxin [Planctomycetes bacterium]|nr:type II toxin-antitoxin system HicB family antitoxin [Planctomycetota bacterium]
MRNHDGSEGAKYTAVFERDESGAWNVHVPEVPGCRTYGRNLAQARRRLREALSLFIDDAEGVEVREDVRLPREARRAVRRSAEARRKADRSGEDARAATMNAVRELVEFGLGVRDAGELLGLSFQRVSQLAGTK